ncbi:MAG: hypothetical protein ABL962_04425, partial [Fimbriimonadaceae bacterium]
ASKKIIEIKPESSSIGVLGDEIPSANNNSTQKHFVTPQQTSEISAPFVVFEATGVAAADFEGTPPKMEFTGGASVQGDKTKRKVSRASAGQTQLRLKSKDGGTDVITNVWVVWADVIPTPGTAAFNPVTGGARYEVSAAAKWRFVFDINPKAIINGPDHPNLDFINDKDAPGTGVPYTTDPNLGPGDFASMKWDVSRQYKATIRNPGSIPKADLISVLPAAYCANQPAIADTPINFPSLDYEGNDDPSISPPDEDANPYLVKTGNALDHQVGQLSSADKPGFPVVNSWGAPGRTFALESNYREFARVELWDGKRTGGQFWFRISELFEWHHYLKVTWDDAAQQWKNATSPASSSSTGHPIP